MMHGPCQAVHSNEMIWFDFLKIIENIISIMDKKKKEKY